MNTQSTLSLFDKIQEKYKNKSIYIISSNEDYYLSLDMKVYLNNSRIVIIHLPLYSPKLNLIERIWFFMRKKVINKKYYPKFDRKNGFRKSIIIFFNYIENFRDDLQKYIGMNMQIIYPSYSKTIMPWE